MAGELRLQPRAHRIDQTLTLLAGIRVVRLGYQTREALAELRYRVDQARRVLREHVIGVFGRERKQPSQELAQNAKCTTHPAATGFDGDGAERSERDAMVLQHLGIYAYTREALARWVALPPHALERVERLEQLRPLAAGMAMGVAVLEEAAPRGIDTEEDLRLANDRWTTLMSGRA